MANAKILLLEGAWSDDIEETHASRDVYSAAETLLRIGPDPVRIIQRPLIRATYLQDIERFVDLDCNQHGPNVIILSAHGRRELTASRKRRKIVIRRHLVAFDGEINISKDLRSLKDKLDRSVIILDSCDVGAAIGSFRKVSDALAVIGFASEVDWAESAVFILATLFELYGVFDDSDARVQETLEAMIAGPYESLADSLSVKTAFRPSQA